MMSAARKQLLKEKQNLKNMSKEKLYEAIIKKKKCDAKALKIIEELIEPNVNPDWLLQNLRFLNKCHMDDIIEERKIMKLCGYVLCSNQLKVIIQQRYHISTRTNRVYNLEKRKKFCSVSCYQASNYLFEQMLDSPLWLRDIENIPIFKILPINSNSTCCDKTVVNSLKKDEVNITSNDYLSNTICNVIDDKESADCSTIEERKKEENISCNTSNCKEQNTYSNTCLSNNVNTKDAQTQGSSINVDSQKLPSYEINPLKLFKNQGNEDCNSEESIKEHHNDDNTREMIIKFENLEVERRSENIQRFHVHSTDAENQSCKNKTNGTETQIPMKNHCLVTHIEQCVKEWITEDTFHLLVGKEDDKNKILESFVQEERYEKLSEKFNKSTIQIMKDHENLEINTNLKSVPDFSVLQEEGKKIQLKVRAFYEGQMTLPDDSTLETESDNNEPILPLTERHAPNAIRRQIFLAKLDTILPNLLHSLVNSENTLSIINYIHNNKRYCLIKILVRTFHLTADNIVFRTGEYTLVGLIIIKMLSLINVEIQPLFQSEKASSYISMILKLYKLDSNYLDRFITQLLNEQRLQKLKL